MHSDAAHWGLERIRAERDALRKEGRRVEPLHYLQQRQPPGGPQGLRDDRAVQLAELEPRIGGVLVLDFHYRAEASARVQQEAVGLAPSLPAAVAKVKPLGWKVGRAREAEEVFVDSALISHPLGPAARVPPGPGEIHRHVMGGVRPVNRRGRPEAPRAGEGL